MRTQRGRTEDAEEPDGGHGGATPDGGREGVRRGTQRSQTRDTEELDGGRKGAGRGRQRSQKDDTIDSYGGAGQRTRSSISRFVFICTG